MMSNKIIIKECVWEIYDQTEPLNVLQKYLESQTTLDEAQIFTAALALEKGIYNISRSLEDLESQIKAAK